MSILLLPHNIPDSLKHLSTLVDDIWYYAGDRSTDVSGSYHPRSPSSSAHTFLSPFHHNPHNIRPASSQVTPLPTPTTPLPVPVYVIATEIVLRHVSDCLPDAAFKNVYPETVPLKSESSF